MSTTSVQRESLNSKARDRRPKSAVGAGRQRNRAVRVPGIWPVARHHTRSGRVDRNRVRTGQPRALPDAQAAAAPARQDWIAWLSLMLSALLPLVIAPEPGNPVSVAIGIVSWLVFVVDAVHEGLLRRYLCTRPGVFKIWPSTQ